MITRDLNLLEYGTAKYGVTKFMDYSGKDLTYLNSVFTHFPSVLGINLYGLFFT